MAVDFTAEDLNRRAGHDLGITALSLTLRSVVGGDAEFAVTTTMMHDTVTFDTTGTLTIDAATGRTKRLELAGPVSGSVGGQAISGTMTTLTTFQFTGP